MFWFVEDHISLILCTACGGAVFTPEMCSGCGLMFHRTCISGHCASCIAKQSLHTLYKKASFPKTAYVLDLKRAINSPAAVYRYVLGDCTRKDVPDETQALSCVKCHCCGESAPFFYKRPFCRGCIEKIDKNEYCPVCLKVYDPGDYEVKMMCCDFCLRWVHLECDSSFKALYHKKPSAVEYRCPPCTENAKRWARLREDFKSNEKAADICSISLDSSEKPVTKKVICTYCGEGSARDAIGFLKPLAGTIPTQLVHSYCGNYVNKKCVKCRAARSSIKCWGCSNYFHLKCAEGLFRQDKDIPFCNFHFYVRALHPEHATKCQGSSEEMPRGKKHKKINMLNKDVVYRPLLFTKILFASGSASLLVFDGKGFYIDGEPTDVGRIKENLLLDVQNNDIFRVKSREYQKYREVLLKNKRHEEVLRALLRIYSGKTKYICGS